ncbi:MAG: hypothetical protein ACM3S2_17225 [Ignavibacteriales bacterium]
MKKYYLTFFILVSCLCLNSVNAQTKPVIAGVEGAYFMPIGKLNERFKPTYGGAFYIGVQTSPKWTWLGKAEYLKFDKVNPERMSLARKITIDGNDQMVTFPIKNLKMDLDVAGLTIDTKYNLIRTDYFETNIDAGFGIYRWTFHRNSMDSLSADVSALSNKTKTAYYSLKKAIAISQQDWNGGFNAGIEFIVTPIQPVSISFTAAYKNIVGELYPSLELDMDNVSTFQMFDLKAGLRIKL